MYDFIFETACDGKIDIYQLSTLNKKLFSCCPNPEYGGSTRKDKICHTDKPHCTVTAGACDLYWNPMLCERLAGRTRILLSKVDSVTRIKVI